MGKLRFEQNQPQEAVEVLKRAIEARPEYASPHYLLGQIYARLGEKSLSEKELRVHGQLKAQERRRTVRTLVVKVR